MSSSSSESGPVAVPCFALELGARYRRQVHHGMVEVEEERFARLRAALEKGFGALHVLDVDVAPYLNRQLLKLMHWLSLAAFEHTRDRVALGVNQGPAATGIRHTSAGCHTTRRIRDRLASDRRNRQCATCLRSRWRSPHQRKYLLASVPSGRGRCDPARVTV